MQTSPHKNFSSDFLTKYFSNINDKRRMEKGNYKHPLQDILFLVLTGTICNQESWEAIEQFGHEELSWFNKKARLLNGVPSIDTMRRVFQAICPKEFAKSMSNWADDLRDTFDNEVIAIDGKTIRGARIKNNLESLAPHVVSAFSYENKLCLSQEIVNKKSNEITAIPKLLESLNIENCIVTIDAMGCQRDIVHSIVSRKGSYLIAVKGNQSALESAIKDTILLEKYDAIDIKENCGHGRVEKRICKVYSNLSHFKEIEKWDSPENFVSIESEIFDKSTKKTTRSIRYYITNLGCDASLINDSVRKHWAVENNLHWSLDVIFNEDSSLKRVENEAVNFSIVRKLALNILAKDQSVKKSKNTKRQKALLNKEYRNYLLGFDSTHPLKTEKEIENELLETIRQNVRINSK